MLYFIFIRVSGRKEFFFQLVKLCVTCLSPFVYVLRIETHICTVSFSHESKSNEYDV